MDYARVFFGEHVCHVPAWMVVQDAGDGMVSFIGSSKIAPVEKHPLRYGSSETHQLIVGEIIVRPHRITHSSARAGQGLSGLATDPFTDLADAEEILGMT